MIIHSIEDFARQFPENGMKLLLQGPLNVRDLLRIACYRFTDHIDFDRLQLDPTTYVQRDYRHLESDVVLCGPLRRGKQTVLIYILIEHQSEPDRLMPFRVLEYVVSIYRGQLRDWSQTHASLVDFVFPPVLPVVFYTGTRRWQAVGQLSDLVAGGGRFAKLAPSLGPLFVNLQKTSATHLASAGGSFGEVLRLVQQRNARGPVFRTLLGNVVRALEAMPQTQRLRWLELLSYIHALVYHERAPAERADLQNHIAQSVQTEQHRQEVNTMRRTIADELRDEGRLTSRRETLLRLIRLRFKEPPADVIVTIEACADIAQLDAWIDGIVTARRLADLGIVPQK
jgi:hypothetical protein